MSLTLQNIIDAARDRDAAFAKQRVPDASFARYLTGYQKELVSRAHEIRPGIIESRISIVLGSVDGLLPTVSPLGQIGASTTQGLPVLGGDQEVSTGASPLTAILDAEVGNTVEIDVANKQGQTVVLVPPTAITATTVNGLTAFGAPGWTVNQFAVPNVYVQILYGTGAGQGLASVLSNTAGQLTLDNNWLVQPDITSVFQIIFAPMIATQETSVVLGLPAYQTRNAYVVKLNAQGQPYIDLTMPLAGTFEQGIPLPQHKALLRGTIYFALNDNPTQSADLNIVDVSHRLYARGPFACWTDNKNLYLIGQGQDWQNVASIDLRYLPEPPNITALTDVFLLPDSAYTPLVEGAAWFAAKRCMNTQDQENVDIGLYTAAKEKAETVWLNELGTRNRAQVSYIREDW